MTASPATELDLWIAGTMHSTTDVEHRLARVGVSLADARRVARELNERGLGDFRCLDAELLKNLFGAPVTVTHEEMIFSVTLWPQHVYRWYVKPDGETASDGGFRRRDPNPVSITRASSAASIEQHLRTWLHTDEDVTSAFGPPPKEEEWWPQRTLYYHLEDEASDMTMTFDHGLLCDIRTA